MLEVVLRALPADGDSRVDVDPRNDRVGDGAPDVVEVDVDAVGAEPLQLVLEAGRRLVIDSGVETQLVAQPRDLRRGRRQPQDLALPDLGDLSHEHADRSGGAGDHHGLSGLRVTEVEEAEVGREARQAQNPEGGGDRRDRRVELPDLATLGRGVLLPAEHPGDRVADLEVRIPGPHHEGDGSTGHHLPERQGAGVRALFAHPCPHVGVERQVDRPHQHLARGGRRQRGKDQGEVRHLRKPHRPGCERDLTVHRCHHRRASFLYPAFGRRAEHRTGGPALARFRSWRSPPPRERSRS